MDNVTLNVAFAVYVNSTAVSALICLVVTALWYSMVNVNLYSAFVTNLCITISYITFTANKNE